MRISHPIQCEDKTRPIYANITPSQATKRVHKYAHSRSLKYQYRADPELPLTPSSLFTRCCLVSNFMERPKGAVFGYE